jgi:hypothetical protein
MDTNREGQPSGVMDSPAKTCVPKGMGIVLSAFRVIGLEGIDEPEIQYRLLGRAVDPRLTRRWARGAVYKTGYLYISQRKSGRVV